MKTFRTLGLAVVGLSLLGLGVGCEQESGVKTETTATNPDGSQTEVTREVKVEQSGENPPPVTP